MAHEESSEFVRAVGQLIAEKLLVDAGSPDEDLLTTGRLDSLTLIQLLVDLEQSFGITISLAELQIEDIRSIRSIAALVEARKERVAGDEHSRHQWTRKRDALQEGSMAGTG